LSVSVDVLAAEAGVRIVSLRFEWSPTQGAVTVMVEHGPPDLLVHIADDGRKATVEDGAVPEEGANLSTSPPWLQKLAEAPGSGSALAAQVIETICTLVQQ
jgi:hypothetical protein